MVPLSLLASSIVINIYEVLVCLEELHMSFVRKSKDKYPKRFNGKSPNWNLAQKRLLVMQYVGQHGAHKRLGQRSMRSDWPLPPR